MTLRTVHTTLLALLILMPIGQVSAKNDDLPETTVEGLVRVPDSKLAIVYADPAADLSAYDSVMILEPYVAFKKNWARNQRSAAGSLSAAPKPADMERIKTLMASEFIEVFDREAARLRTEHGPIRVNRALAEYLGIDADWLASEMDLAIPLSSGGAVITPGGSGVPTDAVWVMSAVSARQPARASAGLPERDG